MSGNENKKKNEWEDYREWIDLSEAADDIDRHTDYTKLCPKCGRMYPEKQNFCTKRECFKDGKGSKLIYRTKCVYCGSDLSEYEGKIAVRYCPECGKALPEKQSEAINKNVPENHSRKEAYKYCIECKKTAGYDEEVCGNCGSLLVESKCDGCGMSYIEHDGEYNKYCVKCGKITPFGKKAVGQYNVGDKIKFGSWPVGISGEVAEAIEWEILEKREDGTAIVLSSKVIDTKPYNTEQKDITWAESSLRKWLNGEFFSKAFNPKEKDAIVEVRLKNADNIGEFTQEYVDYGNKWGLDWSEYLGEKWHTIGGADTTDKVWLLSLEDMKRYGRRFSTDASRIARPMKYLTKRWDFGSSDEKSRELGVVGNAWWWLRSPGSDQRGAAFVGSVGFVRARGSSVANEGGGVRAALKINLNNL